MGGGHRHGGRGQGRLDVDVIQNRFEDQLADIMSAYDEGVAELKVATELLPENPQTQYFYGVALNSLGRFPEALPYLEKAHQPAEAGAG